MSSFGPYLLELLPPYLQKDPEFRIFVEVIGSLFDDAKTVIFNLRRAWFIKLTPDETLSVIGNALLMPMQVNETIDEYRNRLLNASIWYYWQGTDNGVLSAISLETNVNCTIDDYINTSWVLDESQLDVTTSLFDLNYLYMFGLDFAETLDSVTESLIRIIINIVKAAHTMYNIHYPTIENPLILWTLDGSSLNQNTILNN